MTVPLVRAEIADIARTWLGTPYRHRASVRGGGADCLGLVRGIWREAVGAEPADLPIYSPEWFVTAGEDRILRVFGDVFCQISSGPMPGDVIAFRVGAASVCKHLGICASTDPARFIHAYSRRGVVESSLDGFWGRQIAAVFRFPARST